MRTRHCHVRGSSPDTVFRTFRCAIVPRGRTMTDMKIPDPVAIELGVSKVMR